MSNKLENDKYYTPRSVAKYVIDKTYEIIGRDCITEIVEPSAGNGAFSSQVDNCKAFDIEPECDSITKQDFLTLCMDYKKGRLIIGNPPFGSRMNLAQKFFKKSVEMGDYISFILPISQLNNNRTMYEFDLIYSEDMGKVYFTDRELHVCFNVYKRPDEGLNKKPNTKLKDITIIRQDSAKYEDSPYDVRMCYWGDGTAGKILKDDESYAGEYKIIINNQDRHKEIYGFITTFNWNEYFDNIAMKRIKQWQIIEVLERHIPNIQ